ncbi:hypothetical protein P7F88_25065 [Vibrio hannami]|uniref:hypothetical protein n=1 Tax=Vibrio hannami TaxID=2717094 RepID=UPI00240FC4B2|nr:hypothetical protein [Vibrio hannami]MDG3089135.1 hypothetical protein [Vibrio hannami]
MVGKFSNFIKHGLTFNKTAPPEPIATGAQQIGLLIGTAPNKDPSVKYDEPVRLRSPDDVVLLDTTENPQGSLFYPAKYVLEHSRRVLYAIVVEDEAVKTGEEYKTEMLKRIIGGKDASTGKLTGLSAVKNCPDAPTIIGSTMYENEITLINTLGTLAVDTSALACVGLPNTNTAEAITFVDNFGDAHEHVIGADVSIERWGVPICSSAWAMSVALSVDPWESPSNQPVVADSVARPIGHRYTDERSESNELNSYGICVPVRPKRGGFVFWGNRTVTGHWISSVGLENWVQRKLEDAMETEADKMMDFDFFKQEVERINNFFSDARKAGALIDARVYLHQQMNTASSYDSGQWALAIDYGEYMPNEHTVIFFNKDNSITKEYVETVVGELS